MSAEWFIIGAMGGFVLCAIWLNLSAYEWTDRRCQKGKPCGCHTFTNGCGLYRVCEDKPAKEGKDQP